MIILTRARVGALLIVLAVIWSPGVAAAQSEARAVSRPSTLGAADWRAFRALVGSTSNAVSAIPVVSQQAYVKASNTGAEDSFGWSVAVSGDTVVVGAPEEDSSATGVGGSQADELAEDSGAAYVFTRTAGVWSQQAYLKASNTEADDRFGYSVAVDDDTIVVGAWLEDSVSPGINGAESDNSAPGAGAAYVFTRSGTTWSQQAYLKASNPEGGDSFGWSVAVEGDTVIVGAPAEDGGADTSGAPEEPNVRTDSGAAYVFTRSAGTWSQQAYLKASNAWTGYIFGEAVAISGDTAAIGSREEDGSATGVNGTPDLAANEAGAAYVFTRSAGVWSQQAYLKASNTAALDWFGESVAVSGDTVVVGATQEDGGATGVNGEDDDESAFNAGAAYVFTRSGVSWGQEAYLKASNVGQGDNFGRSVAIDGDSIVVSGHGEDGVATGANGADNGAVAAQAGSAYLFTRAGGWAQQAYLKASNTSAGDQFGWSTSISGGTVIVGARNEDSDASGINGDGSNDDAPISGAGYIFGPPCATAPFTDVATDHPFCPEIEWMSQTGVSTGFSDDTYRSTIDVTRQAMSAFLARFSGASLDECTEPPFDDVAIDHPFCEEVKWMKDEGISTGFSDNTYRPSIDVTRQAMSAFLARVAGSTIEPCTTAPFNDVAIDHPFCEEITWMKETGISTGFPDNTYRPSVDVTRQAMSAFLYRLRVLLQ